MKKTKSARRATSFVVQGASVISLDAQNRIFVGDVRISDGTIVEIAPKIRAKTTDEVIKAKGLILMPGFVQCHIHLCQTLFRCQADDMDLLTWLREKIWPMEGALQENDLRASARLGIAELLLGGTTAILDMGTVQHTDVLFEEAERLGLRYAGGKTIMDQGMGYPAGLRESTEQAVHESIRLCETWHEKANGRLRYAFSPRFALSCTEKSMRACVVEARKRGALLHTHASESSEEVQLVHQNTGMSNIQFLHSLGFTGHDVCLAHGVWVTADEQRLLRETRTRIVHCPSANLKLASGIARIAELLDGDIEVALGADGAACNNNLDAFFEMRLLALLHKVRSGPSAVPAERALRTATVQGAKALNLGNVGPIDVGNKGDFVLLDLHKPHVFPDVGDLVSRVVYAAKSSDVHSVFVDGQPVVREGKLVGVNLVKVLQEANSAAVRVQQRIC